MTVKELKKALSEFPETLEVRAISASGNTVYPITTDNLLHTSETAFANGDSPENEWDWEDGKIELGEGKQYLLVNAIII